MTHFSTDALTRLDDFFKVVVWVAAIVTALALVVVWMSGRELDRRRAAVSDELHSQLAATEREAQRLRQKLTPRDVSTEQHDRLLLGLRGSRGELEIVYPADPEAKVFAERIAKVISEAGWRVYLTGAMTYGPVFGFKIVTHDVANPPPSLEPLRSALQSAFGEAIPLQSDPRLSEGQLVLPVGMKPAE